MAVVCSAAAAKNGQLRQPLAQISILSAQLNGISGIEIRGTVEFRVTALGSIAPQTPQPFTPVTLEALLEVVGCASSACSRRQLSRWRHPLLPLPAGFHPSAACRQSRRNRYRQIDASCRADDTTAWDVRHRDGATMSVPTSAKIRV